MKQCQNTRTELLIASSLNLQSSRIYSNPSGAQEMHSILFYFLPLLCSCSLGLILLDILIGELAHYIFNARLLTFILQFFHPTFLFQGIGHKNPLLDYSVARDYFSSVHLHLQIASVNHFSTSSLHIDHSSISTITNDLNLIHQVLTSFKILHGNTSIFLICVPHLFLE